MNKITATRHGSSGKLLGIVVAALLTLCYWQLNKGFSLMDEGYLWYGAKRVMLGEVPIRDFMAYDPGRYYWTAAWMTLIGNNGIIEMRIAVTLFQALGLYLALSLIARSAASEGKHDYLFLITATAILVTWMLPRHKFFDISLSIFLVGILTYLIEKPESKRYFAAGFCVGLIAVFGRNHGVYGVVGSLGVMGWLKIQQPAEPNSFKTTALFGAGIVTGFLPLVLMLILVPGFKMAFWESILVLFENKSTNLPLPVPWPWTVNISELSIGDVVRELLIGFFFIGILIFGVMGVLWAIYQRTTENPAPPALAACAFMAIPYAHYSFSRADVGHLSLGIFPLLIGCLIIAFQKKGMKKWLLSFALLTSSIWTTIVFHAGWQCRYEAQCVTVNISESNLLINSTTADEIKLLRELTEKYTRDDQTILVVPFWPGAYALLDRRSPIWEIYALMKRSTSFQNSEIDRIKASKPSYILILDAPLDGRDDLRFRSTHSSIQNYISSNYHQTNDSPNLIYQIYTPRNP